MSGKNWNKIFYCDHSTRTLRCSIVTTEQDYTDVEKLLNIKKKNIVKGTKTLFKPHANSTWILK